MNKKSTARSAFLTRRALFAVLLSGGACCIVIPAICGLPSFSKTPANISQRTLTFAERVAYQRAIEDVYWRHRIWPKANSKSKPSLDQIMSQAQVEKKVQDYLRDSQALGDVWHRPITPEQLQAEMERMARHTKQAEVLRELFETLANDPFVIAECLARPVLADRLLTRPLNQTSENFDYVLAASFSYTLPVISGTTGGCVQGSWTATSVLNAPTARSDHTAIWTGSEMIVRGGVSESNTGGRYYPSIDSWIPTNTANAHPGDTAIWTGSEMIVWGAYMSAGGRYNPSTDTWTSTSSANAPSHRMAHSAVWTGSEMIVWGGFNGLSSVLNTGGKYNPNTDSWTSTSTLDAPDARTRPTAVWTGSEMIVWGGWDAGSTLFNTGGRYNPSTNSWVPTTTVNAPEGRWQHTAVWTGDEMIIWGGADFGVLNSGGRYNPEIDSWTPTNVGNAPTARTRHTAVWSGSEMIVWGGVGNDALNTGGRYNPTSGTWLPTTIGDAPSPRYDHTAVWTGSEMIVWGGAGQLSDLNTGGRYCAQGGPTPTPTPPATLGNISTRSFVQTDDNVMIGGFIVQGTGTKRVILRAIGPELGQYGVPDPLQDPTLELHDDSGNVIGSNDNWQTTIIGGIVTHDQVQEIQNSGYVPGNPWESAIVAELPPGNYTAIVRGVSNTIGVALVEVYDLATGTSSILSNISTRSFVQTGDNVMIGGFIVQGAGTKRVITRAIGPELSQYGVPDPLQDPTLELHDGSGNVIASNDNWQHTIIGGIITHDQVQEIQNSGYAPGNPWESAIIADLPPGNYTAIVQGWNNTTGVALVDVYDLQ